MDRGEGFAESIAAQLFGSTVFNGITLFKHKGHDGRQGKPNEIKALFPLCVLRVEALSR